MSISVPLFKVFEQIMILFFILAAIFFIFMLFPYYRVIKYLYIKKSQQKRENRYSFANTLHSLPNPFGLIFSAHKIHEKEDQKLQGLKSKFRKYFFTFLLFVIMGIISFIMMIFVSVIG